VRVLRGVRVSEVTNKKNKVTESKPKSDVQPPKPTNDFGESLFGAKPSAHFSSANPFAMNKTASSSLDLFAKPSSNPFAATGLPTSEPAAKSPKSPTSPSDLPKTFASALSINNDSPSFGLPPPPEPWPQESDLPPAYPLYYLDPDYEELDKVEDVKMPRQTMDLDEGGASGSQKEDKDVYEDRIDKTFQRFADRLAQNPEQVLRYEFKGQPLLYSKSDSTGKLISGLGKENSKVITSLMSGNRIPRCANCGSGRVFELQLTPHAIMELEREEFGLDGMEWGNIIIGVCEKDCQQKGVYLGVGYVEEWAGVQWEELGDKR
jgi:pre-rRNA-processing protein TSR4